MSSINKNIETDIKKIVEDLGLYLIDLKYRKDHGEYYLEIYIDALGGLTMDQCEEATRMINQYLDEEDPIDHEYTLIVSSPGLERPLKTDLDFKLAQDFDLELNFYQAINGQKKIFGRLVNYDEKYLYIENENNETIKIARDDISLAKKTVRI